jgi:tripartite-type tricarboxylate transporter receptor subunit TctC
MPLNFVRQLTLLACAITGLTATTLATAQTWPTKPVRLVLQFPPGGSTDVVARILAQTMTSALGQPVVVENKPGADGAIAAEFVLRSEPDGHTYFLASNTPMMQVPLLKKNPPYDPIKSFTPVSLVGRYIYVLVSSPSVPANTAAELIAYGRNHPGKLNYGSYSGVTQLMHTKLKDDAKMDINLIPYKGEGPTINDILGGHVQFTFATPASSQAHVKDGKLKALAILLPKRSPMMPEIPTAAEAGLPPLGADTWAALFGPANMPPAITTRMNEALNAAIANAEAREKISRLGFDLGGSTSAELAEFMQVQLKGWAKAFADSGMKPE